MVLLNSSEIQEKINIIIVWHLFFRLRGFEKSEIECWLVDGEKNQYKWMFERFSFGFIGIHTKGNLYYKYGDTFGFIQNFMFRMFCSNIMLCWGLQHTSSPLPVILIFFCIFSFTVFWKFNQPTKNCAFLNQKINLFLRSIHVSGNIFFETK